MKHTDKMNVKPRRVHVRHTPSAMKPEAVARIAAELALPENMPLREKMDAIEQYLSVRPETSITMACLAANVPKSTYCNHVHWNKRGNIVFAARRRLFLQLIELIHPDKSQVINMVQTLARIHGMGHTLALNTLRKILAANGYKTNKVNQKL